MKPNLGLTYEKWRFFVNYQRAPTNREERRRDFGKTSPKRKPKNPKLVSRKRKARSQQRDRN